MKWSFVLLSAAMGAACCPSPGTAVPVEPRSELPPPPTPLPAAETQPAPTPPRPAPSKPTPSLGATSLPEGWRYTARIHPEGPVVSITLLGRSSGTEERKVLQATAVEIAGEGLAPQTLSLRDDDAETSEVHLLPASEGAHDHGGLVLQDVNFDGYLDFRVMRAMAASPNIPFWFYLYDPAAKAFRRHPALDPVSAPEIDPKGKTLTSTTRASATEYETNVYGWQGGELVVLRRTQKRYLSESEYDETTFERKGGSLQKVGTRRVKED